MVYLFIPSWSGIHCVCQASLKFRCLCASGMKGVYQQTMLEIHFYSATYYIDFSHSTRNLTSCAIMKWVDLTCKNRSSCIIWCSLNHDPSLPPSLHSSTSIQSTGTLVSSSLPHKEVSLCFIAFTGITFFSYLQYPWSSSGILHLYLSLFQFKFKNCKPFQRPD